MNNPRVSGAALDRVLKVLSQGDLARVAEQEQLDFIIQSVPGLAPLASWRFKCPEPGVVDRAARLTARAAETRISAG
jgi:hypothetical protein